MKICRTILIILTFFCLGYSQNSSALVNYQSSKYLYQIKYKAHLTKFESSEKQDDLVLKKLSDNFSFMISVIADDKFASLTPQQFTDFVAANPEELFRTLGSNSLDNLKIVRYGRVSVNRNPAFYFQITGSPKTAEKVFPVEMYHVLTLKGKYLFNLICGSNEGNFSSDYPECQQIINSFAFQSSTSVRPQPKRKKTKSRKF